MSDELNKLLASVKKNLKGVHVSMMQESDIATVTDTIKTPALDLNRILSGKLDVGIPTRAVVGIAGPEGSFKSSFAVICAADASQHGYQPVLIDTEGGLKNEFCMRWGLDTSKAVYVYTPWVEEVLIFLAQLKDSGMQKMIIVLDSIGGLDRFKTLDDALAGDPKADMGALQKNIKTVIKLLTSICVTQNSVAILTGHLYGASGLVPRPDQVGGGYAFRYLPSIFIQLKKEKMKGEGGDIIGSIITAHTTKNRFYPAFQEATIEIDYVKGINRMAGIIDLAVKAGILQKAGSWYSMDDERLGQGAANVTEMLNTNQEFQDKLIGKVNEWLKKTGYSTVNENLKLAEELMFTEMKKTDIPDDEEAEENGTNGKKKSVRSRKKV